MGRLENIDLGDIFTTGIFDADGYFSIPIVKIYKDSPNKDFTNNQRKTPHEGRYSFETESVFCRIKGGKL